MTDEVDSSPRPALPVEAQANLRAALLVELMKAQTELASAVTAMQRDGADPVLVSEGENQRQLLAALQSQLANGSLSVAALRDAVSSGVAASAAVVQQARAQTGNAREANLQALHTASAEARRSTEDFVQAYYEDREFDPYLHFQSEEEERAFREREAERRKAIEEALASGTPEGDILAGKLAHDQMVDAGQYGADESPDYGPMLNELSRANKSASTAQAALENTDQPKQDVFANGKAAGIQLADQTQVGHGIRFGLADEAGLALG